MNNDLILAIFIALFIGAVALYKDKINLKAQLAIAAACTTYLFADAIASPAPSSKFVIVVVGLVWIQQLISKIREQRQN